MVGFEKLMNIFENNSHNCQNRAAHLVRWRGEAFFGEETNLTQIQNKFLPDAAQGDDKNLIGNQSLTAVGSRHQRCFFPERF